MARIVATTDVCDITSSTNASVLDPPVFGKSPLVKIKVPSHDKFVAGSDGVANSNGNAPVTCSDGGLLTVGSGECLPELPEGGLTVAATIQRKVLQAESIYLAVENGHGNQVDTFQINAAPVCK